MAVLNDVLDTDTTLTANVEIKADGIFLSVGERVIALLENKSGGPQVVVYADALRDEPTHVIPIPNKTPCIRVEYDLDFAGGNYSGVGQFAYVPLNDIGHAPDAVEAAFEKLTGHGRVHIVHYCPDKTFDEDGNPWQPLETQL
jgi:hypothetical protein